jgi:WD40 repeat protein
MGDRSGNIRWWDVTTGYSSSFNTHREGIRRIKFSPVVAGDRSRGRIAVLFYDNTFSVFDLVSMKDEIVNFVPCSICALMLLYCTIDRCNAYFVFLGETAKL